jgi:hypothetical protein
MTSPARRNGAFYLRNLSLLWLAAALTLLSECDLGQVEPDHWLILPNGEGGAINVHTTRRDLVRMYGAANVVDQDVDVGEGETQPGTVVFPRDPQRSITILWQDFPRMTLPASAQIEGRSSRWHAVHGISLGTSLRELEKLNGQPFHLSGFGWDYSGTVLSWNKGSLSRGLGEFGGGHGRLIVRLDSRAESRLSAEEQSQVDGDRDILSDQPVMQKLNPRAYEIIWEFPSFTAQP